MQAPHDHEIVEVVPWVPDGHVLEDPTVRTNNVTCLGPYYPPLPLRCPRPPIPTPSPSSWEEIYLQILQSCRCHHCHDLLVPPPATLLPKVQVQVPRNNQLRPPQFLCHLRLHASNSCPVSHCQVTYHDLPAPLPRSQLACNDVLAELAYRLDCEDGGVLIEDHDATLVSAWCWCHNKPISFQ